MRRGHAFTLAELVVSVLLIVLTLFVAFPMLARQRPAEAYADIRVQAATLGYSLLEQRRAGQLPATTGTVTLGGQRNSANWSQTISYKITTVTTGTLEDVTVTVTFDEIFNDTVQTRSINVETLIEQ